MVTQAVRVEVHQKARVLVELELQTKVTMRVAEQMVIQVAVVREQLARRARQVKQVMAVMA